MTAPCGNPEGEYPCSRTPPFAHPSTPRRSAKCRNRRTNRLSLSITHLPSDADHGRRHAVSAKQRDFWRERTCGVCLSCPKRHVPTYKFLAMAVGRSWDLSTRRNFRLGVRREHTLSAEAVTDAKVVVGQARRRHGAGWARPAICFELFALTGRELQRMQDRVLLLVKKAHERVRKLCP